MLASQSRVAVPVLAVAIPSTSSSGDSSCQTGTCSNRPGHVEGDESSSCVHTACDRHVYPMSVVLNSTEVLSQVIVSCLFQAWSVCP